MPSLPSSTAANPHLNDPVLQPFLGSSFDPTAYLNNALPSLAVPSTTQPIIPSKSLSVADLSSRTQTHIAQLSAQTTRLSNILTDLTDAILRSGPRLAYSVELLRGEANALADAMADTLTEEIKEFVPAGIDARNPASEGEVDENGQGLTSGDTTQIKDGSTGTDAAADPPDLARLRSLHHVRAQLQSVMAIFDAALSWPLPPSSLSIAQSLVSVSAPQSSVETTSLEERGQAAQNTLRDSVVELLSPDGRSAGAEGVLRAEVRVKELRQLASVWKGTAEEKARNRFVDGLEKIVVDRRVEEERRCALKGLEQASADASREETKKGGLFGGLRRLREEIYLE